MRISNFLLVSTIVAAGVAQADTNLGKPTEIDAPISKIFIPEGFDDNDIVEVIAAGEFPNSCYRVGQSQFEIDEITKTISIKLSAYRYESEICLQAVTPFIAPIKLNIVNAGSYQVQLAGSRANFQVDKATTSSPDSFFYAQVNSAKLTTDPMTKQQTVSLEGEYPNMFVGCAVMKEVKTYLGPTDVLVVLPILEVLDDADCPADYTNSFKVSHVVENPLQGEGLMHVRVLNGNSLNKLVRFEN